MRGGQLPPLLRLEEIYMADVEAFERLQVELELPPTQHGNATAMCLDKGRTKLATFVFNKKIGNSLANLTSGFPIFS